MALHRQRSAPHQKTGKILKINTLLWARLLVNASVSKQGVELRRAYIDILERLSPFEAQILERIYSLSEEELQRNGVITGYLPKAAQVEKEGDTEQHIEPNKDVTMALANLSRLGCIALPTAWNGGEIFSIVYPTVMGRGLIDACTINKKSKLNLRIYCPLLMRAIDKEAPILLTSTVVNDHAPCESWPSGSLRARAVR